ncbi:MAG: hypothetical protein C0601_05805 [Candidatus Muiribacterium halophilum]|uniref:YjgP/YjgQ family permease n=1 Tax=Muiribacterium halophilum TaxID=2053465 RepID=A0A2N5ZH74_MUIH1|nr:MAG: hypothetical protein C0601_05805 [Candidatus Muirbacterium halophilum]
MKYLDRYIVKEFFSPFFFGLFIYITIFIVDILMDLIDLFLTKDVPLIYIFKLFVYNIPALLVLVIPMSVLFATLLVIGNFSAQSEVIAFKSGGVSFYRITAPFFTLGVLLSIFSFFLADVVVPRANTKTKQVYNQILSKKPLPEITPGDFNAIGDKNIFFAGEEKDGEYLSNLLFEVNKEFPVLIIAKKAFIKGKSWIFSQGKIYDFGNTGQNYRRMDFNQMTTPVVIEKEINSTAKNSSEMNFFELKKKIDMYEKAKIDTKKLRYDLYMKTSLPLASLVFILIGAPLALAPVKTGKSIGMGLSILIIFLYYIFISVGKVLGTNGKIDPFLGAWLPNLVFITLGVILVIKARR